MNKSYFEFVLGLITGIAVGMILGLLSGCGDPAPDYATHYTDASVDVDPRAYCSAQAKILLNYYEVGDEFVIVQQNDSVHASYCATPECGIDHETAYEYWSTRNQVRAIYRIETRELEDPIYLFDSRLGTLTKIYTYQCNGLTGEMVP